MYLENGDFNVKIFKISLDSSLAGAFRINLSGKVTVRRPKFHLRVGTGGK